MEPGHIIKFLSFCWWNKNVPVLLTMLVLCAGPPISVPELLTVSTCDFFSEACPWPPGASSAQPYEEREENLCSPKLVLGQCLKYWDREGQTVCSLVGTNLRGNSRSRAPRGVRVKVSSMGLPWNCTLGFFPLFSCFPHFPGNATFEKHAVCFWGTWHLKWERRRGRS